MPTAGSTTKPITDSRGTTDPEALFSGSFTDIALTQQSVGDTPISIAMGAGTVTANMISGTVTAGSTVTNPLVSLSVSGAASFTGQFLQFFNTSGLSVFTVGGTGAIGLPRLSAGATGLAATQIGAPSASILTLAAGVSAPTVPAISVTLGATPGSTVPWISLTNIFTATTVGAAGAGAALPATPTGYFTMTINGSLQKVPYYAP